MTSYNALCTRERCKKAISAIKSKAWEGITIKIELYAYFNPGLKPSKIHGAKNPTDYHATNQPSWQVKRNGKWNGLLKQVQKQRTRNREPIHRTIIMTLVEKSLYYLYFPSFLQKKGRFSLSFFGSKDSSNWRCN